MNCLSVPTEIMEEAILLEIEEIRKRMQCSKGFICAESGYKKLCRAKDVGMDHHLLCLEYAPSLCDFALLFDNKYYCACPLRVFLTKNLQKNKLNGIKAV